MSNAVRNLGSHRSVDSTARAVPGAAADSGASEGQFAAVMNLAIGAAAGSEAAHSGAGDAGAGGGRSARRPGSDADPAASSTAGGEIDALSPTDPLDLGQPSPTSGVTAPSMLADTGTAVSPPTTAVTPAIIAAVGALSKTSVGLPADMNAIAPAMHRGDRRHHDEKPNDDQADAAALSIGTLAAPTDPTVYNPPGAGTANTAAPVLVMGATSFAPPPQPDSAVGAAPQTSARSDRGARVGTAVTISAPPILAAPSSSAPPAQSAAGAVPQTDAPSDLGPRVAGPGRFLNNPLVGAAPRPGIMGVASAPSDASQAGSAASPTVDDDASGVVAAVASTDAPRHDHGGFSVAARPDGVAALPNSAPSAAAASLVGQIGDGTATADFSRDPGADSGPQSDRRDIVATASTQTPASAALQPVFAGIAIQSAGVAPPSGARDRQSLDGSAAVDASGLAGAPTAAPAIAPASASAGATDTGSLGTGQSFADALASHVMNLVSTGHQEATLQLQPPQLGDLTVRVAVQGRDVSAWFGAAQPQVQQAVSQSLDQLRLDLAGAGFNLSGAWVGADTSSMQRQFEAASTPQRRPGFASAAIEPTTTDGAGTTPRSSAVSIYV